MIGQTVSESPSTASNATETAAPTAAADGEAKREIEERMRELEQHIAVEEKLLVGVEAMQQAYKGKRTKEAQQVEEQRTAIVERLTELRQEYETCRALIVKK